MNKGKCRLIALDIDGTIVDRVAGVRLHKKMRKAVKDARADGARVCLCSARPSYYMQDATHGLDGIDALIGCSGAMIERDGEFLYKDAIPLPQLLACFETGKRLDLYMSFAGDDKIFVSKKGPVLPSLEYGSVFVIMEDDKLLEALHTKAFYGAYIFTRAGVTKEDMFGDPCFADATIHKSSSSSFNLTNRGTNKGTGVLRVAELWDIPREEILAIGNDENDIPMFNAAGVGVAVANASPEALAVADWIAPDVRHAGAAEAIRRFAL